MTTARLIAEVTVAHDELVLCPTIRSLPALTVEFEYQTIAAPEEYYAFFHVTGGDLDEFDAAVAEDPTVSAPSVIIRGEDFRVYRMRVTWIDRLVLPAAAELGIRVLHATSGNGGWIATLEVADLETLQAFRDLCRERGVDYHLERLYQPGNGASGDQFGLTPIQRDTLVTAYQAGYFNSPRDATVAELADDLEISSSAVSDRLRRGLGQLVAATLVE